MAYPGGGENFDDRIINLIKENTKIRFARTTISSYGFDSQKDLLSFNPTVHHTEWDKMLDLAQEFIHLKPDTPKLFYIWGHSYEFDIFDTWDKFDEFCSIISGKDDIFYGINSEVLLK